MLCAMMLTDWPAALEAMSRDRASARSSILLEAGTEVVITRMLLDVRAWVMPRQYWREGRKGPNRWSSSKPRRPWARIMGFWGVSGLMLAGRG